MNDKNREIKFRIWDVERKQMRYLEPLQALYISWGDVKVEANNEDSKEMGTYWNYAKDKAIIQQFTGVKDKNNREIYEGDLIKYTYVYDVDPEGIKIDEVIWRGTCCADEYCSYIECWMVGNFPLSSWRDGGVFYGRGTEIYREHGIEIVGNVFENPELLTATQTN